MGFRELKDQRVKALADEFEGMLKASQNDREFRHVMKELIRETERCLSMLIRKEISETLSKYT